MLVVLSPLLSLCLTLEMLLYVLGAFLIPYIILLVLIGKPMYYMEAALGQYSQLGPVAVWKCAPVAKGMNHATSSPETIGLYMFSVTKNLPRPHFA